MQRRNHGKKSPARTPDGTVMWVPETHWRDLGKRDLDLLCAVALAEPPSQGTIRLPFLHQTLVVDVENRTVTGPGETLWQKVDRSLVELLALVYLLNVQPAGLAGEMVGAAQLRDAQFFQGPHLLDTGRLIRCYGNDAAGFAAAARRLGGRPLDMADAAFELRPFPRIPLYYLLWEGDEEFEPRLSILFDRSIEKHFAADAVWGTVNLVSRLLV
jgi:hypothetical protein